MLRKAEKTILKIYETLKGSSLRYTVRTFSYETFLKFRTVQKGFVREGSDRVSRGRTFYGFVDFKNRFSAFRSIWKLLDTYGTFLRGSIKYPFFTVWSTVTEIKTDRRLDTSLNYIN
jgi:hypothetical protein